MEGYGLWLRAGYVRLVSCGGVFVLGDNCSWSNAHYFAQANVEIFGEVRQGLQNIA
jgi:hypothetical protein